MPKCGYIKKSRQNRIPAFTLLSLIFDQALRAEVFSETKTPVKKRIVLSKAWYLLGLDREAAAGRTFRLDGIERLQVLDEGFVRLPHPRLAPEVEGLFWPV